MKKTVLISFLVVCLLGGAVAQNSQNVSQVPTNVNQNQTSQTNELVVGHGQILSNPNGVSGNSNVNSNLPNNHHHMKNGDHALGHVWDSAACGLNYTQGSTLVETRYNQYAVSTFGTGLPTSVNISALPPNAVVVKAFVWWEVSYQTGSSTSPTLTITNPNGSTSTITATLAGTDGPKCWAEDGTRAFRVDLPVATSSTGGAIGCNGVYNINITGNSAWEVDGVTVFIVYIDPAATYTGHVYLYDGMISMVAGTITQDITGMNVCAAPIYGEAFSIACDFQDNLGSPHDATFDNITYTGLYSNGFYEFDTHQENFTAGQTICTNGYSSGGDCYGWHMTGCYYQTTCTTCLPTNGSNIVLTMDSVNTTCNQSNGTATVTATGGSGSPYTYAWSNGQITQTATGLGAGVYYVTVTDASGCHSRTDSVTILASNNVTVTMTATNVNCFGYVNGQIIATATGGVTPYSYAWTPSGGNTLTAANLGAGIYNFTVTDGTGCTKVTIDSVTQPAQLVVTSAPTGELCFGTATGTVPLSVTGGTTPYSYTWSPAQGNIATAINLNAGNYSYTVTDAHGCSANNSATVIEPPLLTVSLSPSATICIGQSSTLTATAGGGTPAYTYSWSNGSALATQTVSPVVTTAYSITLTDANGCTATVAPINIVVNPPLTVVPHATDYICLGQSAVIGANATGGNGTYTYTWDNGIGVSSGSITVTPAVTTVYNVTVSDNCTVPDVTTTDTVFVNPAPIVNFTGLPLTGCQPLTVNFNNQTTSTLPITNWAWDYGDGSAAGDSMNGSHIYTNAGTFTVKLTATSASGCSSFFVDSNYVTVYPLPVAHFTIDPNATTIVTPEINFNDFSIGATYVTYNFGDGGTSNVRNITHNYVDTGLFWVTQFVMTDKGCRDSTSGTVRINDDYEFYIPEAFTPNGDGLNEHFFGYGKGITEYNMNIFDRWGELLFTSNDLGLGWDGRYNGTICAQGTYIYEISYKDNNHASHHVTGRLNLLK